MKSASPISVVYFRVHDLTYPRNSRMRAYLASNDIAVAVLERVRHGGRGRRLGTEIRRLWLAARGARAIVVSEFNLQYAAVAWVVARLRRCKLIVDGFVGMYETEVSDWGRVSPSSFTARRLQFLDWLALRLSDVFLIDTEIRASAIRRRRARAEVMALPVGAPAWSLPQPIRKDDGTLRLLYYGNYIPLHGVPTVVDAVAIASAHRRIRLLLIGDGSARSIIERRVEQLALVDIVSFLDPVPESQLIDWIRDVDVVLGVFGTSEKARTVVPNKVWQGIASGRQVVTQPSVALEDMPERAGDLLVQTRDCSAEALAEALLTIRQIGEGEITNMADRIEAWVELRFRPLAEYLRPTA